MSENNPRLEPLERIKESKDLAESLDMKLGYVNDSFEQGDFRKLSKILKNLEYLEEQERLRLLLNERGNKGEKPLDFNEINEIIEEIEDYSDKLELIEGIFESRLYYLKLLIQEFRNQEYDFKNR